MTTNAGLDNRALLPPFLPVGRNEDGIFALTLHVCAEDALIGHLPLAIHHDPDVPRSFPAAAFLDPSPRFAEVIAAIMRACVSTPGRRSVSERVSTLGTFISDLGALKTADFEEQVRTIWLAVTSHSVGFLQSLLDLHHGQPDYWAKDVLAMIENFKDFTLHGSPAVPRELSGIQPVEQAKESCRRLVRNFGELLRWWPVIYSAATRLRADGIRLARPI
jgi:hypothetical protein